MPILYVLVDVHVILSWMYVLSLGMNVSVLHVYSVFYLRFCNLLLFLQTLMEESFEVDPKKNMTEPLIQSLCSRWWNKNQDNNNLTGVCQVLHIHNYVS